MKFFYKVVVGCVGLVACLAASAASAASDPQISISIEPVWWQYQEQSPLRPGISLTPLNSTVSGFAMATTVELAQTFDGTWLVKTAWTGFMSMPDAHERWNLATGFQSNQFNIRESEFQLDVLGHIDLFHLGVWSSYQWQQQRRQRFFLNGAAVMGLNEPVKETVNIIWGGVALEWMGVSRTISLRFDAALPVWVRVTNTLLVGGFEARDGYRIGGEIAWELPWVVTAGRLSMQARYEFRQLNGQLTATALWPKNSLQVLAAGLRLDW